MVIDTSALLSILLAEPEAESFARAIAVQSSGEPLLCKGDDFSRTAVRLWSAVE